ncbi:MAG: hypothetical protein WEB63_00595 [Cucumibacter sp.]
MSDEIRVLDRGFLAANTVSVSDAALTVARDLMSSVSGNWIAGFDWAFARRHKLSPTEDWHEIGPGLDLGGFARKRIPPAAICRAGTLEYVVKIPREIVLQSKQRLIDVDPTAFSKLGLR